MKRVRVVCAQNACSITNLKGPREVVNTRRIHKARRESKPLDLETSSQRDVESATAGMLHRAAPRQDAQGGRDDTDERLRQALENIRLHNRSLSYGADPMPNPHSPSVYVQPTQAPSPKGKDAAPKPPLKQRLFAPMLGLVGGKASKDSRPEPLRASPQTHPASLTPGVLQWSPSSSHYLSKPHPVPARPPSWDVAQRPHSYQQWPTSAASSPTKHPPAQIQFPASPSRNGPIPSPTPLTPTHRRTQSAVDQTSRSQALDTPTKEGKRQCAGIKKDGSRCTRFINTTGPSRSRGASPSPARALTPSTSKTTLDALEDDPPDYCFQHAAEINKTSGFHLPDGTHIHFADYIPAKLSARAQARLRSVMTSPPTAVDQREAGYIYVYELRDRATKGTVCLKVGRSINVFKRMDEWRSKCQSKDPMLRCFLPAPQGQMLLVGASSASQPGLALSRKWERLCHLELEDAGTRLSEECKDCGSRHREIFSIPLQDGGYPAVQKMVQRWQKFIALSAQAYTSGAI